jgi:hypothetical protein
MPQAFTDNLDAFVASLPSAELLQGLDTSWAGELACYFPETSPSNNTVDAVPHDGSSAIVPAYTTQVEQVEATAESTTAHLADMPTFGQGSGNAQWSTLAPNMSGKDEEVTDLLAKFEAIEQPPAAILIGGIERWKRLQDYLCDLGAHSRAVRNSLLCVAAVLHLDSGGLDKDHFAAGYGRILSRHAVACDEIKSKLAKCADVKPKTREHLLAAIFLLSVSRAVISVK